MHAVGLCFRHAVGFCFRHAVGFCFRHAVGLGFGHAVGLGFRHAVGLEFGHAVRLGFVMGVTFKPDLGFFRGLVSKTRPNPMATEDCRRIGIWACRRIGIWACRRCHFYPRPWFFQGFGEENQAQSYGN